MVACVFLTVVLEVVAGLFGFGEPGLFVVRIVMYAVIGVDVGFVQVLVAEGLAGLTVWRRCVRWWAVPLGGAFELRVERVERGVGHAAQLTLVGVPVDHDVGDDLGAAVAAGFGTGGLLGHG